MSVNLIREPVRMLAPMHTPQIPHHSRRQVLPVADELLAAGGAYKKLYAPQFRNGIHQFTLPNDITDLRTVLTDILLSRKQMRFRNPAIRCQTKRKLP